MNVRTTLLTFLDVKDALQLMKVDRSFRQTINFDHFKQCFALKEKSLEKAFSLKV